jgi:hypothetical protein
MAPFAPARTLRSAYPAPAARPPIGSTTGLVVLDVDAAGGGDRPAPRTPTGDAVMGKSQGVAPGGVPGPACGIRGSTLADTRHQARSLCRNRSRHRRRKPLGDPGAGDVDHRLVVLELGAGADGRGRRRPAPPAAAPAAAPLRPGGPYTPCDPA